MRKNLCPNHHYYDADKYERCPFCDKEDSGKGERKEQPDPGTRPLTGGIKGKIRGRGKKVENNNEEPQEIDTGQESESKLFENNDTSNKESLQSELKHINGNEPKTQSFWGNQFIDEPVAGWFACIGGPCVGETYEIFSGKNAIGRNMGKDNRIVIRQDAKISGVRHTTVMYDPKGRKFYLLPAEGVNTTYLNDEIALNAVELNARDILQVGDTSLMLVPLCGPEFSWEDWMKKEE